MDINLDTSDWRLWVMCVVILGCLAFWLGAVGLAARSQSRYRPRHGSNGPVQGGAVQGGAIVDTTARSGPSVPPPAPDRDSAVSMPVQQAESPTDHVQPHQGQ
jgi:hypothetical protein